MHSILDSTDKCKGFLFENPFGLELLAEARKININEQFMHLLVVQTDTSNKLLQDL